MTPEEVSQAITDAAADRRPDPVRSTRPERAGSHAGPLDYRWTRRDGSRSQGAGRPGSRARRDLGRGRRCSCSRRSSSTRVFVLLPIVQAVYYSLFKWNGLKPLDRLRRARRTTSGRWPTRSSSGPSRTTSLIIVLSLAIQIPFALGLALDAQPAVPRSAAPPADVLRAVRHLRGHHRHRLPAPAPAGRSGRPGARRRSGSAICPGLAGGPRRS